VAAGRAAVAGVPPFVPEADTRAGRIVRDAVAVAAQEAMRERDEALVEHIGWSVGHHVALFYAGKLPNTPPEVG
jgi:sorbitol-specific phosphotransferase system component IIBC